LINGKAVEARSGRTSGSRNPYTGEPWAVVPDGSSEDVDDAVAAARAALDGEWGATTGFARAAGAGRQVAAGSVPRRQPRRAWGRENGVQAMDEYLVDKAVRVELTGGTRDLFTLG
jgi:hypothetical protein